MATKIKPHNHHILGDVYAQRCREYETLYLSAGLKYPVDAFNVAVVTKLTDRSFAFAPHRRVFGWICFAAIRDFTFTLESFREINLMDGHTLQSAEVEEFWCIEVVPSGLCSWARRVKDLEVTRSRIGRLKKAQERMLERCVA